MKKMNFPTIAIWVGLVLLSCLLTFHIPVGGQSAKFSCLAVVLPLIGALCRTSIALPMAGLFWFFLQGFHLTGTFGIPTLFALLSWRTSDRKDVKYYCLHVLLPLAIMVVFTALGGRAWPYSLFWLVPVVLAFLPTTLFGRALQSTFLQHAVGGGIWVCFIPLTAQQWLALIPVVAIERLLAASLSVAVLGCLQATGCYFVRERKGVVTGRNQIEMVEL